MQLIFLSFKVGNPEQARNDEDKDALITTLKEELKSKNEEIIALRLKVKNLQQAPNNEDLNMIKTLTQDLEELNEEHQTLNKELLAKCTLISDLRTQISVYEERVRQLSETVKSLNDVIQELKGNIRAFCRVNNKKKTVHLILKYPTQTTLASVRPRNLRIFLSIESFNWKIKKLSSKK